MYVRLMGTVRKPNNEKVISIDQNTAIISEVTEIDASQPWNVKVKTVHTGDAWLRNDSYSHALLPVGAMVKLKSGEIVTVYSSGDAMFSYVDACGKVIRKNYVDKNGDLIFEAASAEEIEATRSEFNEFSKTYKDFLGLMDKYYPNQYREAFVRKNFISYLTHKNGLVEMLRKHPNWNEAEKAVIVEAEVTCKPNKNQACAILDEMRSVITFETRAQNNAFFWMKDGYSIMYDSNGVPSYTNYITDRINYALDEHIAYNTKATRVVRMVLDKYATITDQHKFEKLYAAFADELTSRRKKVRFVVSANICDFVTMSHGNSWSSCHSFEKKGGWHAGSLSYANDYVTLVAYALDANGSNSDLYSQRKIFRNLFMLNEDQNEYIQSRTYPNTNLFSREDINHLFNEILKGCGVNISETPIIAKGSGKYLDGKNFLQYQDYKYHENAIRYGGNETTIVIGNGVFNIGNGKLLATSSYMSRDTFDSDSKCVIKIVKKNDPAKSEANAA